MRQLALPFGHVPMFDGVAFIAQPSNAQALALLAADAAWPSGRLALWGGEGRGKTHLLHRWAAQAGAPVLAGATLRLAPPTGPAAIDDADLAPERMLLHWLNASAEAGYPVLLASRAAPARWAVALPDLASRLRAMLAVEVQAPEEALLQMLLARLLADRHLPVAEPVQAFLLARLPRTASAIREASALLDRVCLEARARPTRALAAQVVAEITGHGRNDDREPGRFHEDAEIPMAAASPGAPFLL
jgi:chromosomal replication initiation ATPase DnaA